MNKIQKYENGEAIKALDKAIELLNRKGTKTDLIETTVISKKYRVVNGAESKEITVTKSNTLIVDFVDGQYKSREVVFHDKGVLAKLGLMTAKLENKNIFATVMDILRTKYRRR